MIARQNFLTRLLGSRTLDAVVVAARDSRCSPDAAADAARRTILQSDVRAGVACVELDGYFERKRKRGAGISSAENYESA